MNPRAYTDFLVPTSSFLTGAGSVINLAGNYFDYNVSDSPEEADYKATLNDWLVLAQDLRVAMGSHEMVELLAGRKSAE